MTRSGDLTEKASLNYATLSGTASAPSDYTSTSGKVNFNVGQTTKTIVVSVNGDKKIEPDETFFVNLSTCDKCTFTGSQGLGTIKNDD